MHDIARPDPGADGRFAEDVFHIPLAGWKQILKRTVTQFGAHNVSLIAGGATFFLLLAIFPALAAFVALYGLVADVSSVQQHIALLSGVLPAAAVDLVGEQLTRLASQSGSSLGFGFAFGIAVALWSANAGIKAVFSALNVVYDENEARGFVRLTLVSLAFTLTAIIGAMVLIFAVVVAPGVLGRLGLGGATETLISLGRWPILLVLVMLGIGVLYKYGPSRRPVRWHWITWGSGVTAILWVAMSIGFSFYLANFADYNATYGSLGAIIGFMMWLYLSLTILLAGAALNAEIEHQVVTDTTVGPFAPMGQRRAVKADTLPDA